MPPAMCRRCAAPASWASSPTLKPGDSYSYTSGCPLKTSSGFMVGAYQMQLASGEFINVEIPAFSLDSPHEKHAIN